LEALHVRIDARDTRSIVELLGDWYTFMYGEITREHRTPARYLVP
jgi:hypothetical protein